MARTREKKTKSAVLKSVYIKNYQAHKKTKLVLHPGINVITGKSHSGKSAIIRALKKLVFNKPRGAKFYSNFAPSKGNTIVKGSFKDGTIVKLTNSVSKSQVDGKTVKKSTKQFYHVTMPSGGREEYKGKVAVPDNVQSALDLGDINFQYQHDPPLLLSTSNFKLAKLVSDITNLDRAYTVKSEVQKRLRKANAEEGVIQKNIKRLRKKLKLYKPLSKLKQIVSKVSQYESKRTLLREELIELEEAHRDLIGLSEREVSIVEAMDGLTDIIEKIKKADILKEKKSADLVLLKSAYSTIKAYRSTKAALATVSTEFIRTLKESEICPVCGQDTTGL